MRALVTGGTGFVGSHLVEALHRRGDTVTALVRSPRKAASLERLGVRIVAGDLHTPAALAVAAAGQDVVYHVAGLVAARDEAGFLRANRDGTAALLAAAERDGAAPRFVLVSSMAAAGPAPRGTPLRGDAPPRPVTAYGRSKLAAEEVVRGARIPWTVVRPPTVYGPRDVEVLKVFRIARTGVGPVFGDGSQELSAVHAADLADALVAAGTAPAAAGGTYYACHPEVFTSAELVRRIAAAMGRQVALLRIPRPVGRTALTVTELAARLTRQATILTRDKANEFFQDAWTGDPAPLTQATGWAARRDLTTGLAETYAWYRAEGWL